MKAAVVTAYGPPEVLHIREVPTPDPAPTQVRIRVRSIGLNFADVFARMGLYPGVPRPPFTPGIEVAGEIERCGANVRDRSVGEHVIAFTPFNGYAEYVCVSATRAFPIPAELSWETAASLLVTSLTAWHGLVTLAGVRKGERVVIHAAAGGVGTVAVQLAAHRGAEIFATAGSKEKLELARSLGADHVIDYTREDFAEVVRSATDGYGADVIYDSVGGRIFKRGWRLLAPMGRYVLYGFAAAAGPRRMNWFRAAREAWAMRLPLAYTWPSRNISLHAFNLFFLASKTDELNAAASALLDLYQRNVLKPVIGATFPFERIADAQACLQSRASVGKVVVLVGD